MLGHGGRATRTIDHVRRACRALIAAALTSCGNVSPEAAAAQQCAEPAVPSRTETVTTIPGAIPVVLLRLAPGCDSVVVSSAIPLPPGALRPDQITRVRLLVNGVEQPRHVEALASTHRDGSLRSIFVQLQYPLNTGVSVPGQLVLAAEGAARARPPVQADRGTPRAVILPTDPKYLVSTQIVGPTLTAAAAASISPVHAKYESDFQKAADRHWDARGAVWEENYYDRAHIYYAWWVRTGNVEYWKRATAMALSYRRDYLEANGYKPAAHWVQIEGLVDHYLLTGDESSRTAVGRVAAGFSAPYYMDHLGDLGAEMDNRMQARTLSAFLAASRINATGAGAPNGSWSPLIDRAVTTILASEESSGAYGFTRTNNQCGHTKPFMVGLLNDALIDYYDNVRPDPRVASAVRRSVDYLWTHDWLPAKTSFVYLDGPCPGYDEHQAAAPDLNNLIVNGFAWVYARTRDPSYRTRADSIFAGGVNGAWLDGSKQFNEQYASSFRYLAYRR